MLSNVKNALLRADKLADVDYIKNKIETTQKINRRTLVGRELTEELLRECNKRARELIDAGELPFN